MHSVLEQRKQWQKQYISVGKTDLSYNSMGLCRNFTFFYLLITFVDKNVLLLTKKKFSFWSLMRENSWKPSHWWLCCKISRFLVWLHLHWFWVMKNPAFSLIMASSLSSVLCVGLEHYSSSSSMWLVAAKSRYWVFGRGNILWWVFRDSVLLCFSTDDQSWPKKLIQFLQKLKNCKIILKNHI